MANGGLRYQFSMLNVAEKLVTVCVLLYLIDYLLLGVVGFSLSDWFMLPKEFNAFLRLPWSILSYSFLHGDIFHLIFNMFMLYYIGRIFFNFHNNKRFAYVYFLGVLVGGCVFLLTYNTLPNLMAAQTPGLVGASAGIMSVLIFLCAFTPNQEVRLLFFNVKLWHIGAVLVAVDVLLITAGNNVGGRLAHLGGVLLGYFYARQLLNGHDIGESLSNSFSAFGSIFKPSTKEPPLKTVYKKSQAKGKKTAADYDKMAHQRKIDAILDKISKSGYESLSKAEKDFLFKAGKED